MNRPRLLLGLAAAALVAPARGQGMDHAMHDMPGMSMPAAPPRRAAEKPAAKRRAPVRPDAPHRAQSSQRPDPHAGHDMHAMEGMATGGQPPAATIPAPPPPHDMSAMPGMAMGGDRAAAKAGTDLPPGDRPAPPPSGDHLADRIWGAGAMAMSRERDLRRENGGMTFYQVMFNLAEYQARKGRDGYRWDGEAWVGGDIDRLWLKTEGEGRVGGAVGGAEVQALYSHALDPYWNLQAGIRHDIKPSPSRSYATVGIEGLAPYLFEVGGALFLSNKGEVLARVEGYYDQRITNYVVLQPRVEANLAAQNIRATGTGAGLSDLEAGLRLRYEGRREFAPYVGVSWQRQFGDTARYARARGDGTGGVSFVAGARTWF